MAKRENVTPPLVVRLTEVLATGLHRTLQDFRGPLIAAVLQYNNRHPGELSGDSLRVYESRVRGVIENFVGSVTTNPTGYKPPAKQAGKPRRTQEPRKGLDAPTPQASNAKDGMEPQHASARASVTETSLAIPFPLRPTFLAQIVIPRDMTKDEAKRLGAFIDALAHDPSPARG